MAVPTVRPANADDAPAVAALHVEGWQAFRPFVPPEVLAARDLEHRAREWRQRLSAQDARWWTAVAELDAEPLGFVTVEHLAEPGLAGARSEIHHLFVTAAWRRRGIGRHLLAAAARWIAAKSAEPVSLYSFTDNPHRVAYSRLGGQPVGERRSAWDGVTIAETCYIWPTAADLLNHVT